MPSILNIANINSENKSSSKIKLNTGEKISGKLVKDDKTGEIKVRLREGIEIPAEIEGNSKFIDNDKLIKFEIKGFKDGKLNLKIVNSQTSALKDQENEIETFIKQQGLFKDDADIVKSMIKHDMKLSREEVLKVRTLLQFKYDVKESKEDIDKFINSFLKSKGISNESKEGKKILKVLNKFFEKLGNLKNEEVLTMLENNIELNNENIESFLKLTKENRRAMKTLEKVLKIQKQQDGVLTINQSLKNEVDIKFKNLEKDNKPLENNKMFKKEEKSNNTLNANKETLVNSKSLENLKLEDNKLKNLLKDIVLSKNSEGNIKDPIKVLTNLRGLTEESIISKLETLCKDSNLPLNKIDKDKIQTVISSSLGENIILKEEEIENIKTVFNNIKGENSECEENKIKHNLISIRDKSEINNKEIEKNSVNIQNKNGESINKDNIENKNGEIINKENIEDNNLKNFKSIKTLSKEVLNLKNNVITIENQIKEKCSEIKNLVKEIINKGENGTLTVSKETISDLKVLNSLNNNYYMLDLPLKLNEREIECKLMIKDDRKSGKNIDSKNVKLVVTIDTVNMGKIDGYLKVLDNNLNIDLKCNEKWIKPISLGKNVLLESLQAMGYSISLSVSKRIEDANISTCREFFNDNNILVLDKMV